MQISNGSPFITLKASIILNGNSGFHQAVKVVGRYYDAVTGLVGTDPKVYIDYFQDGDLLKFRYKDE